MSEKILITGGAGFIGARLTRALTAQGNEVTILDNLLPQVHGVSPETDSPNFALVHDVARVVRASVTDAAAVAEAVEGADVIFHLAAETGTGQSMYEIDRYVDVNVGGTAKLLEAVAARKERPRRVIVASSRSIYGEGKYESPNLGLVYPGARREEDLLAGRFEPTYPGSGGELSVLPTSEDSEVHPSSVYGITKSSQEALVMAVAPTLGVEPVALRFQNVYGPGQSLSNPYTGILSIFSSLILSGRPINVFEDGLESRDFVYVDDVVDALVRSMQMDAVAGEAVNVGSGIATTVNEVVAALLDNYGRTVPVEVSGNFRVGDIRHNFADISKQTDLLNFTPAMDFATGIREFCNWVQSQVIDSSGYERSLAEMREKRLLK